MDEAGNWSRQIQEREKSQGQTMRRRQSAAFVAERESAEDSEWVRYETEDGRPYYYARTKTSSWERPHRPGMSAKVILHQSSNNSNGGGEMRKGGAEQSRGLRSSERKIEKGLHRRKRGGGEKKKETKALSIRIQSGAGREILINDIAPETPIAEVQRKIARRWSNFDISHQRLIMRGKTMLAQGLCDTSPVSELHLKENEKIFVMRRLSSAGPQAFKSYPEDPEVLEAMQRSREEHASTVARANFDSFFDSVRARRISKRGFLYKRSRGVFGSWQRRYFVIYDTGELHYYRHEPRGEDESSLGPPHRAFQLHEAYHARWGKLPHGIQARKGLSHD